MEICLTDEKSTAEVAGIRRNPADLPPQHEAAWWFDELHVRLYRYLVFHGLGPEDAEEVVQDTFLRLHRHLTRRGSRTNLGGWIFQVARNAAQDRRKSARWQRTVALDPDGVFIDAKAGPEDQAIHAERTRKLQAAIGYLSPQQRECILLRISGLRYREIAEVLRINVASVGELVERARTRLSEDLS